MKARRSRNTLYTALIAGVGLVSVFAILAIGCSAAPRYSGPVSDHFDGKRFRNVGPFEERGFSDLLRWKLGSSKATPWPSFVEIPPSAPPPAQVNQGLRLTFVNHATTLLQLSGVNVLTDPVWSKRVGPTSVLGQRRHKQPGIRFEDLPRIHLVVISHNHYDHLDLKTLRRLSDRDAPLILAGLGTARLLLSHGINHAVDLDWWNSQSVGGLKVTFLPAQHWSTRSVADRNLNLWGSYYFESGALRVYFAGDTGFGPHFERIAKRLGPPTLALLPIGAYAPRWFMKPQHIDPAEAVAAHRILGAQKSVAIHWGTFQQADEGMNDPPRELEQALLFAKIPKDNFVVLENGQSLVME